MITQTAIFRVFTCFLALPALLHGQQEQSETHRSIASPSLPRLDEEESNNLQRGSAESISGIESSRTSRALFLGAFIDLLQGLFISGADPVPRPSATPAPAGYGLPSSSNFTPIRINCGGSVITDAAGNTWMGDVYHNGAGSSVGWSFDNLFNLLFGSEDSGLFQSYRVSSRFFQAPLRYKIPVPNGRYQGGSNYSNVNLWCLLQFQNRLTDVFFFHSFSVTMYFAELFVFAPGWRRFDVRVEDQLSFTSVDIAKQTGGPRKAVALTTMAIVQDGELLIKFDAFNRDPFVSAIEVMGVPDAPTASPTAVPSRETTDAGSLANSGAPSHSPAGKPTISLTPLPSTSPSTYNPSGSLPASPTRASVPINNPPINNPPTDTPGKTTASPTLEPSVSPTAASRLNFSPSTSPTQKNPYEFPTTRRPTQSPTSASTNSPSTLPTMSPTCAPMNIPTTESTTESQTALPTILPSSFPAVPPTNFPTFVPSVAPTRAPVTIVQKTASPVTISTLAPIQSPTSSPIKRPAFESIRINAGGGEYVDFQGNKWKADQFFSGGYTYNSGSTPISDTLNDELYQSERYGAFEYQIPVDTGEYEIILHFAEVSIQSGCAKDPSARP